MDEKWCVIVAVISISLMANGIEPLFMCLLATWLSSLEKYLFDSFAHFKIVLFVFSLLNCKSSLYRDTKSYQLYDFQIFSFFWFFTLFPFPFLSFPFLSFLFSFVFLGLHPWHLEVPRLGVKSELQMPATATAITMPDLSTSATYTTAHGNAGSSTHWARPGIEPASSWIIDLFPLSHDRNSRFFTFLMVSFKAQKFLFWWHNDLLIFSFVAHVISKNHCLTQGYKDLRLYFLLRIYSLVLWSNELIFIYIWCEVRVQLHSLVHSYSVCPVPFILFFPHWINLAPSLKINWP